jgi:hypothetical protein
MKNRDCPVNIFSTVLSLLPDPYWKIRTIWFDFETAEVIEKTALIRIW